MSYGLARSVARVEYGAVGSPRGPTRAVLCYGAGMHVQAMAGASVSQCIIALQQPQGYMIRMVDVRLCDGAAGGRCGTGLICRHFAEAPAGVCG